MSYKSILAAASGGTASDGVVALACRLAQRFSAHIEGFHVRLDPQELIMSAADGMGMPLAGGWTDGIENEAAATAAKAKAAFLTAAAAAGLAAAETAQQGGSAAWREEMGNASAALSARARFFDLVVLGRSDRVVDQPHSDAVEETLMRSGRPVLLAPAQPDATIGQTIALGWNGSPEAVRALTAALPFLAEAKSVFVIAIGAEPQPDELAAVAAYLASHGVTATPRDLRPISGLGAGAQLLAEARDAGADLLVMGGYGHTPWRELLFGGATRDVVGASLLPVLLSH